MGRFGVSYEEVAQAVQEAQGKGKSPTVDNVRLIIGSGSKSYHCASSSGLAQPTRHCSWQ